MKTAVLGACAVFAAIQTVSADVSVTVYNSDLAVVKQTESFTMEKGIQSVSLTGVAERIDPTSVRFKPQKNDIAVLEQNYRYDLVNSEKILRKYIDRDVRLFLENGTMIKGVLQSVAGDVVIRDETGGVTIIRTGTIERFSLPDLPEGLITRPTLVWKVNSAVAGPVQSEVSYMTGGMSWHAEYTAVVEEDEKSMDLSSWVSIENNSGAAYKGASLKLVAGDVNRAPQPQPMYRKEMMAAAPMMDQSAGFAERSFFEYHLYDLGRKTDISNAEIKQIALFDPTTVRAKKTFTYDGRKNPEKVAVSMEFKNGESEGLGMALPAGTVRVYTKDTDDSLEFVGEDTVDHTPKNEMVRLTLGYAFDIVAERTVKESQRLSPQVMRQAIELSLRNRKEEKVTVTVVEHFRGDWHISANSHPYVKKDSQTAEFTVNIPADSETAITYTVIIQ